MNEQIDPAIETDPNTDAKHVQAVYLAHCHCERISGRLVFLRSVSGNSENGLWICDEEKVAHVAEWKGLWICDEEKAAYVAACKLLADAFYCAGG